MAELTVGPVVVPRSPAASANCLNFQKHAGQAALKTAKKSKKMPNMPKKVNIVMSKLKIPVLRKLD